MTNVFVLGGQQSDFERNFSKERKGIVAILRETMEAAFLATGLDYEIIGKLAKNNRVAAFVGNFDSEQYCRQGHLGSFLTELDPVFYGVPSARYEAACASSSVAIDAAISKIRLGDIDLAVVVGLELMKTVDSSICGDYLGTAAYYQKEAAGKEYPFPKLFGRLADAYIERYPIGETRYMDALARISDKNYRNAKANPLAQTRKWFMSFDQASHRGTQTNAYVGGRLAISDCSQVTDGAVVLFLASDKFAEEYLKHCNMNGLQLPRIAGWGNRVAPFQFDEKLKESKNQPFILPWTRRTVLDAYGMAGVNADDIDVIETHDCFTSSEYAAISAFGIAKPGEEYKAIESGVTEMAGRFPINPSGGLIGAGHPVGASGARMMLDLYKQLSGNAGGYQVQKDMHFGAMLNIGGSATTNYVFILQK